MDAELIAQGPVECMVGRLLPCPCCGAPAAVGYSAKAQLGLPGWTADCTVCTESAQYTRFTRDRAVESWNTYAAQPVTPNAKVTGASPRKDTEHD